jgi:DNA processing protein
LSTPASELSEEQRALLALHLVPNLGPRRLAALLEKFGSAAAVLDASAAELLQVPYIGDILANQFRAALDHIDVDQELALVAEHGVRLLFQAEGDYPALLKTIPDPPPVLYVRGELLPEDQQAVAIVGTRHCTAYGRRVAERLARDLARTGWTVVSGLARGIDASAHRGALAGGGRTLAVLANGLSRIYPPEHAGLANEVVAAGAVLSEASMNMEPLAGMFPARNRIISGLARGVVIVEAGDRSGALITAEHALEQGREVFAVPGPVDSAASAGVLELLRHGARLVRHADDIIEDLEGIPPPVPPPDDDRPEQNKPEIALLPPELDPVQQRIWDFLVEQPRHVDEITRHLEMPVVDVSRCLMLLEIKKLIRRLPGNRYERVR